MSGIMRAALSNMANRQSNVGRGGIDQVARWEDLIGPVSNLVLIIQGLYRRCLTSGVLAVARVS